MSSGKMGLRFFQATKDIYNMSTRIIHAVNLKHQQIYLEAIRCFASIQERPR